METVIVKIESTYISLAYVRKSGGRYLVLAMKRVPLPEHVVGQEAGKVPDLVAALLITTLGTSGFPVKNLCLYLGGGTELFAEYRFSETLTEQTRKQRRDQTEKALLAGASAPLYRVKDYEYDGTDDGLSASATLAADPNFCDRLKSVLAKEGFTVTLISSSLAAFAETAKTVAGLGDRVIVLGAEKREMQAALFIKGRLARLARIAKGTSAQDPVKPLLPYITGETKVVLCGHEANDERFRERLRQAGAIAVGAVLPGMTEEADRVTLSGDLAYEDDMFPWAFASTAFFGEEGALSYFSEERDVKKTGSVFRIARVVVLVIAVFACALPLATLAGAERDTEANRVRLGQPFYAEAAEKLDSYRALVSEYSELLAAEATLTEREPSYAAMLEDAVSGLLTDTRILEMYFEKGKGILVDLTTKDAEAFDYRKAAAERNKDIFLYEAKPRVEIGEDEWHIQIRITHAPSARDGS